MLIQPPSTLSPSHVSAPSSIPDVAGVSLSLKPVATSGGQGGSAASQGGASSPSPALLRLSGEAVGSGTPPADVISTSLPAGSPASSQPAAAPAASTAAASVSADSAVAGRMRLEVVSVKSDGVVLLKQADGSLWEGKLPPATAQRLSAGSVLTVQTGAGGGTPSASSSSAVQVHIAEAFAPPASSAGGAAGTSSQAPTLSPQAATQLSQVLTGQSMPLRISDTAALAAALSARAGTAFTEGGTSSAPSQTAAASAAASSGALQGGHTPQTAAFTVLRAAPNGWVTLAMAAPAPSTEDTVLGGQADTSVSPSVLASPAASTLPTVQIRLPEGTPPLPLGTRLTLSFLNGAASATVVKLAAPVAEPSAPLASPPPVMLLRPSPQIIRLLPLSFATPQPIAPTLVQGRVIGQTSAPLAAGQALSYTVELSNGLQTIARSPIPLAEGSLFTMRLTNDGLLEVLSLSSGTAAREFPQQPPKGMEALASRPAASPPAGTAPLVLSAAPPLAAGEDLLLPAGQIVTGLITAQEGDGIVQIQLGDGRILHARSGNLLPVGTALTLHMLEDGTADLLSLTPPTTGARTETAALLAKDWPTLSHVLAVLQDKSPALAARLLAALPHLADGFPAVADFAQAVRHNSADLLWGKDTMDVMQRMGIDWKQDFAHLNQLQQQTGAEGWKGVLFPYIEEDGHPPRQGGFFWRKQRQDTPREPTAGKTEEGSDNLRFIVNLALSELGPVQVDGLLRQRHIWLKVRSTLPITELDSAALQSVLRTAGKSLSYTLDVAVEQHAYPFATDPLKDIAGEASPHSYVDVNA